MTGENKYRMMYQDPDSGEYVNGGDFDTQDLVEQEMNQIDFDSYWILVDESGEPVQ